jgi:hypothetical protein
MNRAYCKEVVNKFLELWMVSVRLKDLLLLENCIHHLQRHRSPSILTLVKLVTSKLDDRLRTHLRVLW